MHKVWPWIAGVVVTVLLIMLIGYGSPGRQAHYKALRGSSRSAAMTQSQMDAPLPQGAYILHLLAVRQRR
jgi:hypothetical protein